MVAEQGRPTDPMPPQLKTPYHENSSIVAGVDGVVEPLDLVRFRSRWPPRPGLPPPAGAKRPRRNLTSDVGPLIRLAQSLPKTLLQMSPGWEGRAAASILDYY